MTVHLRAGVHAAIISPDLVLLDLVDDSYFCLPDGGRACTRAADGQLTIAPGEVADTLSDAGLVQDAAPCRAEPLPAVATTSLIHSLKVHRSKACEIAAAVAAIGDMGRLRPGAGLGRYLAITKTSQPLCREPDRVLSAARVFWTLAPWLPLEGECLVRSAMLVSFLRRRGLAADWVFGVRLWPFEAHCWVQLGDTCLNDDFERLVPYTPILCR